MPLFSILCKCTPFDKMMAQTHSCNRLLLLSNAKINETLDITELKKAFFYKLDDNENYLKCEPKIKEMCEKIINNMVCNFSYSKDTALEAVIYAFKKEIIDLSKIIKREEKQEK